MKSLMEELVYDKEVVKSLRAAEVNNALLYTHLISGKITLQEYLRLVEAGKLTNVK